MTIIGLQTRDYMPVISVVSYTFETYFIKHDTLYHSLSPSVKIYSMCAGSDTLDLIEVNKIV